MNKRRPFSVVKAVKANARERVGAVPPQRVIPGPQQRASAPPKHKETLAEILHRNEREER